MTAPADDHSENETPAPDTPAEQKQTEAGKSKDIDASKALATAGSSPVNPFLAAASEAEEKIEVAAAPRSLVSRMLDYSAHAAIIVGLVGFAWTVSDHFINRPAALKTSDAQPLAAAAVPAQTQKADEMTQLRQANLKMHEDIKALKASIDAMRIAMRRDTTSEQVRMLSAGLDNVKSSLGTMRSDTTTAIAQLNGKLDKLQPGKMHELNDRLGRLEHQQATDPTATGSIGKAEPKHAETARQDIEKATAPTPPVKPAALAKVEEPSNDKAGDAKPDVISGVFVRDVYRGVALIEGRRGTMEVVVGMNIPGAGVVKSIERRGGNWVVLTSKGEIPYEAQTARNTHPAAASPAPYGYGRGGYSPYYRYGY